MRRILLWSAAALILAAGSAVAFLILADLSQYRSTIEARIGAMLGRGVTIAGDLEVEVSLVPTLAATDLTIANIPGGSREHMARIGRVEIELQLLPLLIGTVRINELVIEDSEILLEVGADGVGNWVFGSDGARVDPPSTYSDDSEEFVARLELRRTTVSLTGRLGRMRDLQISHAILQTKPSSDGFELEIDLMLEGRQVQGEVTSRSLSSLLSGAADWPVAFEVRVADSRLSAAGTIKDTTTFDSYRLDIDADIGSPGQIAELLGLDLPELPVFSIRANADGDPDGVQLSGLTAEFGASKMAGDLAFSFAGNRPGIAGDLHFERLDLADVLGGSAFDPGGADDDAVIPADAFGDTNIDLRLQVEELALEVYRLSVSDVRGSIRLIDRRLEISVEEAVFFDGELIADVVLDVGDMPASASIDLTASHFDAGALLAFLTISEGLVGYADLTVTLEGNGMSPRSLFGTSNGRIAIDLVSGEVYRDLLDDVKGRAPTIALTIGVEEETELRCFIGHFDVADGIATSTTLLIDGDDATVGGKGAIDLGNYLMDFIISARSKDATEINLAIPVRIYGRIDDPEVSVMTEEFMASAAVGLLLGVIIDPLAIIIPFLGTGSGEDDPCRAAIDSRGATE